MGIGVHTPMIAELGGELRAEYTDNAWITVHGEATKRNMVPRPFAEMSGELHCGKLPCFAISFCSEHEYVPLMIVRGSSLASNWTLLQFFTDISAETQSEMQRFCLNESDFCPRERPNRGMWVRTKHAWLNAIAFDNAVQIAASYEKKMPNGRSIYGACAIAAVEYMQLEKKTVLSIRQNVESDIVSYTIRGLEAKD